MLILAFETSAKAASVALLEENKLLGENYQNTGLTHSQTLMPMAEDLLKNCGKTVRDLTAVAVANGPGSFTGVRIGVAAAKGLAWGLEIPCYGVSTLEAMAKNLGVWSGMVVPTMDARRNQTYTAIFEAADGKLTRILEDCAISYEELAEKLKNFQKPIFLVGDGANLCYNTLKDRVSGLVLPPEHRTHQRAAGVALVAAEMAAAGIPGDAAALTPNYLRLSQAERERLAREEK
ncbi:MAG: tRNA (adenosine(37)-N6)-threonylcarbamoyltransferase complex dimerization subunit type 1 TsaB [Oscillospiraceae bacterium]|nr:tRNA (adenosine(37)-N6)-threonylcarbamoyltransferase complex dimerization subunit type 1 TsaB [Oscillospiraceae bacterium]